MISDVITGASDKFLVIIGPCSADNEDSVCDYTNRLAKLQDKVEDRLVLVPRIYTKNRVLQGRAIRACSTSRTLRQSRTYWQAFWPSATCTSVPCRRQALSSADEMLYPDNYHYLSACSPYVAIGARSVEHEETRHMVSGLDVSCGIENPTSGDFSVVPQLRSCRTAGT